MLNKNILSVVLITAAFIFSAVSRIEKMAAYNFVAGMAYGADIPDKALPPGEFCPDRKIVWVAPTTPSQATISYNFNAADYTPTIYETHPDLIASALNSLQGGAGITFNSVAAGSLNILGINQTTLEGAIADNDFIQFSFTTGSFYYSQFLGFLNQINMKIKLDPSDVGLKAWWYFNDTSAGNGFGQLVLQQLDNFGEAGNFVDISAINPQQLEPNTTYWVRIYLYDPNVAGGAIVTIDDPSMTFFELTCSDFGDNPDTAGGAETGDYGTTRDDNGASHKVVSGLSLGAITDVEDGTLQNATANADDADDLSDEDGVVIGSLKTFYEPGRLSYGASVEVAVTNNTAESAQLVCWVDWGQDGAFDTADRSEALIYGTGCLAGTGATDATFTTGNVAAGCSGTATVLWTDLASVPASGQVYSRCRITTDGSGTGTGFFSDSSPLPTGALNSGEVEDDLLNLNPTFVSIGKIGLRAYKPAMLLAELLGIESMSHAALMELLSVWDPDLADSLGAVDSETLLAALRGYLDPDGDGRVAVLQWETTTERGTIGFYVERNDDGGQGAWHRINDDMLPGLITAPMGGYYWLADPEARSGGNYLYRMIEQEARGGQNTYGPYPLRLQ